MNLSDLAKIVREKRSSLGLSREALAELADIHPRTLENFERCHVNTRFGVVVSILNACGLTLCCVGFDSVYPHNVDASAFETDG